KRLLYADRSALFLVDKERNELYSRIADSVAGKEIRFPCGQGIAGVVASNGIGENILDAYQDPRFNREVDKQLGYRTQTLLCEPIVLNGEILAVVQLVNKLNEAGEVTVFTESDRETFRVFSLFAGISINNSHLLEFAVKAGREMMELNENRALAGGRTGSLRNIKRPLAITEAERQAVRDINLAHLDITSIDFDLFYLRENMELPLDAAAAVAYRLIVGTGLPQKLRCRDDTLLNFILQCRKKYRNVPYHNFYHVVDVCQTIYTFLYKGAVCEKLTELDCFVLLVTALVHDLDHMGLNNSFYLKTDSPLGILSSASGNASVLEVHHCNLAVEILSDPDSDVFEGLDAADRTLAYRSMIDCV
ncbi:cAMP phosphodiesterase, partial [Trypanosoma cruzi]